MSSFQSPFVSAVLCTLNEISNVENIRKNVLHLSGNEIIIVDGGSTDGTWEFISQLEGVNAIQLKGSGLLSQRLYGIGMSSTKLVFLYNADDQLCSINMLNLKEELYSENLDGLALSLKSVADGSISSAWWDEYFSIISQSALKSSVLGRPCLTKKKLFDGLVCSENIFNEDTWLRYQQFRIHGKLSYGVSRQSLSRKCLSTVSENAKQFRRYGRSDKKCAHSFSQWLDLLFHILIRTCFWRSLLMALKLKPRLSFITLYFGLNRLYAFIFD